MALEHQARGFSFLPRQPASSVLAGRHGSRLRGRGLNFEELRHYRIGDDIRSMDWKTTNRTGKPHVRVYSEERERSVYLLVDQRISMFFGSRYKMKSVVAAEVAALAAWRVLGVGDRLGAAVFSDAKREFSMRPQRSRGAALRLFRALSDFNAELAAGQQLREEALNEALIRLAPSMAHDALLVYIGDGLGWNATTDTLVRRIAVHNDLVVVHIADPAEGQLPDVDNLVLSDGARQLSLTSGDKSLRRRFSTAHREHIDRMLAALRRFDLPLIQLDTASDPLPQLLRALGNPR